MVGQAPLEPYVILRPANALRMQGFFMNTHGNEASHCVLVSGILK